ncbi:MAG: bifunctional [glutamate--ammonia ligase]-adenylyl-L-tyrosine phosphorylase/[glutamate--ammonia-ligase] adenylyltransferase [Proteobacteria bacterium]|nr:bifunctional [glutamate--ammonia ligase]-adenylyl-L-tyrosine phosphorylase/[glutamate--ammonia-ligase] adenylyltransferase [Pseudomonadota bacterium]
MVSRWAFAAELHAAGGVYTVALAGLGGAASPGSLVTAAVNRALERLTGVGAVPAVPAAELAHVLACSDFIAAALLADPALVAAPTRSEEAPFAVAAALTDEPAFMAELRRVRRRELARIAWRDLTGATDPHHTLAALSRLADAAIRTADAFAEQALRARYGLPCDEQGRPQPLVVVAMGKLGGGELNFSSDIDLIFLFAEGGETNGPRPVDNVEYFLRRGQKLIQLLDAATVDGFVYRVDMRLRPFGDSGPLVASFAALEDYLQQHGRDWERYAWVKARAVTGSEAYESLFRDVIRPFVFRRYLDFGVFASLREMKSMISREVARRDLSDDVKLGRGGIREIEFIVQALQLVRGGSDARLRPQSLLTVLPRLSGQKLLPEEAVRELGEAYNFLRRVENRLQMYADEQTHRLPTDPERRARIEVACGFADWQALVDAYTLRRNVVERHFATLVLAGADGVSPAAADFDSAFSGATAPEALTDALRALGLGETAPAAALLVELRGGGYYRRLDEPGRRRLHALLPRLLSAAALHAQPDTTLRRALSVVEAIGSRTAYLALLNENPLALARLTDICALGAFLPGQVAAFPLLLDELIDPRLFDQPPTRAQFAEEIELRLADEAIDTEVEHSVEALRQVQRAAIFRVALFDLTGRLPLMRVSDRLTDIAELILERAMAHAWAVMIAQYGAPFCGTPGALRPCGVAAVGYGKLGGHELGYASDLDLVFLHDSAGEVQETQGPKVIDNAVFFLRFGQKIVHFLTTHTTAGRLYEVDMRLRPSGKGGLLMTNIDAFVDYQRAEAWTWEHQALLHSRAVAGTPLIRAAFERARIDLLCHHVRRDSLREDVRQMREWMRRELSRAGADEFDLKQDPGGVADIEFLAQYFVLRWAGEYPPLVTFADTIRALESVGSAALVDHRVIDGLVEGYRTYRRLTHRLSLEERRLVVPAQGHAARRAWITAVWDAVMVRGEELRPGSTPVSPAPV